MVPESSPIHAHHPRSWIGSTHVLRLNTQIYSEARHLLHNKPNRVTLDVFQPLATPKQPLVLSCQPERTSWALRKYTLQQVSRMNNLTIRIPYFEWQDWPEHSLVCHETISPFDEVKEGEKRQMNEITRQLGILAAAASHNPDLRKLTLAFRRWKEQGGFDKVHPTARVYMVLKSVLEPLVRFRDPDFDIRAISYEQSTTKVAGQNRVELLAPWFNNARADWVRRVKEARAIQDLTLCPPLIAHLTPTAVTDFDSWVPWNMWEHGHPHDQKIPYFKLFGYEGMSRVCARCRLEVLPPGADREEPGRYRQEGEDGEEWDGDCVVKGAAYWSHSFKEDLYSASFPHIGTVTFSYVCTG